VITEYDAASSQPTEPGLSLRHLAFDPYLLIIPPDWQVTVRDPRDLAGPWVAGPPGTYTRDHHGNYQPYGIVVLAVTTAGIRRISSFGNPGMVTVFGFRPDITQAEVDPSGA
jgi:hypothetical protein